MNKILSLIIPAYNMEAYLPKCLGSLIVDDKELLQKLDVIVVNDGSEDSTYEIAHGFESKYPGVFRVIDKPNGHYGSCINAALPVVAGVFVKVLDADDSFDTGNLEILLAWMDGESDNLAKNKVDVVFTDMSKVNCDDKVTGCSNLLLPEGEPFSLDTIIDVFPYGVVMHEIAYRVGVLRHINYRQLEGVCYTDTLWCFLPMANIRKGIYFPKSIYRYLLGREGQSADIKVVQKNLRMYMAVFEEMVRQYELWCPKLPVCGVNYLRHQMMLFLELLYRIAIFIPNIKDSVAKFDEIEKFLAGLSKEMYDLAGLVTITRKCKLRYVIYLRHLKYMQGAYILFLRLLKRAIGNIAMVRQLIMKK